MSIQLTTTEISEVFWSVNKLNEVAMEHLDQLTIEITYFDSNGEVVGTYNPHNEVFTTGAES